MTGSSLTSKHNEVGITETANSCTEINKLFKTQQIYNKNKNRRSGRAHVGTPGPSHASVATIPAQPSAPRRKQQRPRHRRKMSATH